MLASTNVGRELGVYYNMTFNGAGFPARRTGTSDPSAEPVALTVADFARSDLPALHRFALALCGQVEQAEDLVADALQHSVDPWDDVRYARAHVRRAITHQYLNDRRAERVQERHRSDVLREESVADASAKVAHRIDLRVALLTLPAQSRAVVVLRYLEDRSVAETADILGRPEGTIRRISYEALRALRVVPGLNSTSNGTETS